MTQSPQVHRLARAHPLVGSAQTSAGAGAEFTAVQGEWRRQAG